uniref:DUF4283 domain-containing protein n=1 Tax=Vitis vinifera TaxID=29760 RepID=A5ARB1_VITVI|nr:hypothetical protein VITISV_001151 [Vitis vinifera]
MVRTLKFSVEKKTFLVRFEGESEGFEKEEAGWLIEHLAKAIELKSYMGFNRKYRGKSRVHLMEVCFNNHEHLKKIVEQWGTVIEIDWRTLKLYDLCKARVRILVKERSILPTLIAVLDGGWVFTISVVVVGVEDERRVREMGSRRLVEKANPMAKGWSYNGVVDRLKVGVESQKAEEASEGAHGKRSADVGNSYFQSSSPGNLNSNTKRIGSFRPKLFGEVWVGRDKAHSSSIKEGKDIAFEEGTQMVRRFSSSPLTFSRPLGFRRSCSGEGVLSTRGDADNQQRSYLKASIQSKGKAKLCKLSNDFVGNPNLDVVESQLACLNQMSEGINSIKTLPSLPIKAPNLVTDCPVEAEFSSLGGFQIKGLSPSKMARVRVVLSSLDIKVYSRRKNKISTSLRICGYNILVSKIALEVGGEVFRDLVGKERKKSILSDIANIDAVEQEGVLSSELSAQRALRKGELEELILRRNRKFIKILENERGLVLNNIDSITEEILLFYEKLYSSPPGESWRVEGLDWSPISAESAFRLDSPFTEEEISKAIFQLDGNKALGPNGFTIAVLQDCWDVIKEALVRVFAEFHRSGVINQSTNATFIVLVPKKS